MVDCLVCAKLGESNNINSLSSRISELLGHRCIYTDDWEIWVKDCQHNQQKLNAISSGLKEVTLSLLRKYLSINQVPRTVVNTWSQLFSKAQPSYQNGLSKLEEVTELQGF